MAILLVTELSAGPLTDKQAQLLSAAREDCDRLQAIVVELPQRTGARRQQCVHVAHVGHVTGIGIERELAQDALHRAAHLAPAAVEQHGEVGA